MFSLKYTEKFKIKDRIYLHMFRGLVYCCVLFLNIGVMFRYVICQYMFD